MSSFIQRIFKICTTNVLVFSIISLNLVSPWSHSHSDTDHHGGKGHFHHTHIELASDNVPIDVDEFDAKYNKVLASHLLNCPDVFINFNVTQQYKLSTSHKDIKYTLCNHVFHAHSIYSKTGYPLKFPIYNPLKEYFQIKTNLSPPLC